MSSSSRLLVALVAASLGCLPRGAPPAGRQIIADRHASLVATVPPNGDGVLRILVTRPGTAAPDALDLYVIALDADGKPSTETLVVPDFDVSSGVGCNFNTAPCYAVQARGVWADTVARMDGPQGPVPAKQIWADPVTGYSSVLPGVTTRSPSGQKVFTFDAGSAPGITPSTGTLYDVDGTSVKLDDITYPRFTDNDDFYYATVEGELIRMPPSGVPEQVTSGLGQTAASPLGPTRSPYQLLATPDGALLILNRPTSDPSVQQWVARDPLTGSETVLPFGNSAMLSVSTDGRWLVDGSGLFLDKFTLFDYRANDTEVVNLPTTANSPIWRPGHDELWTTSATWTSDTTATLRVYIMRPGAAPVMVPDLALGGGFTPDGAYWLATPDYASSKARIQVGPADDPTAPLVALNAPDTIADPIWKLPDDRLVAAVYVKETDIQERTDAVLLDPRTGDSRVLGQRGRIAAVGQTRVMGMFHFEEERGDLTVSDLEGGQPTMLAPEFAVTAFAEPQGADQLAPGTRIVYQFQARTDSPYDGVWLVTCP